VTVWCTLSSIGVIESYFLKRVESQLLWMPVDTATCWRIFCARKLTKMGKNTT
jgi:hypothetical protein